AAPPRARARLPAPAWPAALRAGSARGAGGGRVSALPRIRVLVIDDSAFSRQLITRMLEGSPLVEVVGTARDGEDALRKVLELAPDLITLDLEMPRMDGFTLLRLAMSRRPTPVIVISGRGVAGDVFRALELGAVDFIAKPTREATLRLEAIEGELLRKVHAVRELRLEALRARALRRAPARAAAAGAAAPAARAPRVLALRASTGGPPPPVESLAAFGRPPPAAVPLPPPL